MLGGAAMAAGAAYDASNTVPLNLSKDALDSDIDFDLDFSASDMSAEGNGMGQAAYAAEPTVAIRAIPEPDPMVDFDMSEPAPLQSIKLSAPDLASLNNSLAFSNDSAFAASAPTAPMALKTAPSEPSLLEFDLGNLSLDLPGATAASNAVDAGVSGDPMETKLALAAEFRDIGDADGARALVQEVADEASGALKARAVKMLADLG